MNKINWQHKLHKGDQIKLPHFSREPVTILEIDWVSLDFANITDTDGNQYKVSISEIK